jgi:hypothetical protein
MSDITPVLQSPEGSQKSQRTALSVEALVQSFLDNLLFVQGRSRERATVNDLYMALAHTVRDHLGCACGLLLVGGVSDRTASGQQFGQPWDLQRS